MKKKCFFFCGDIGSALNLHSISSGYLSFSFFRHISDYYMKSKQIDYYMKSKHINVGSVICPHASSECKFEMEVNHFQILLIDVTFYH